MKSHLFLILVFVNVLAFSQKIKVKSQALLPKELIESSGLVAGSENTVWTHNDSGGEPVIYQLNQDAEIIRQVRLLGVKNVDWEDMANDFQSHVYIADIGNNLNARKDLKIYKIPHPDALQVDSVKPEIIAFSYENQTHFPPALDQLNFDAEALIAYEDSLFIFTKNRSKPFSKYTYIYALPNEAGAHVAVLKDSLYLKRTKKYFSWITGATRHPHQDFLVLLSHKKAWTIKGFRTSNRVELKRTKVSGIYSQKEAIAFAKDGSLWISNEKFKVLRAKLKKAQLSKKTITFDPVLK